MRFVRMKQFNSWVERNAAMKWIIPLFLLQMVFQVLLNGILAIDFLQYSGGRAILDTAIGYDAAYAKDLLMNTSDEGWHFYLTRYLPADMIFPIIYSLSFALLASYLVQKAFSATNWLHVLVTLPFLSAIFDYVENAGLTIMILILPDFSSGIAQITSVASLFKWATIFFGSGIMVVCLIKIAWSAFSLRR